MKPLRPAAMQKVCVLKRSHAMRKRQRKCVIPAFSCLQICRINGFCSACGWKAGRRLPPSPARCIACINMFTVGFGALPRALQLGREIALCKRSRVCNGIAASPQCKRFPCNQQSHGKDRALMRVDAAGCCKHGLLRRNAFRAQLRHDLHWVVFPPGQNACCHARKIRTQCRCASKEQR